jgi:hypothetical protein
MYWSTGFANELALHSSSNDNKIYQDLEGETNTAGTTTYFPQSTDIVSIQPSSQAAFFVSCTQSSIQLWSVKVGLQHFESYIVP